MKTIYLIGILVMFLSSCKKEVPETTISGVVVNYGTLQPIDSVLVTVISGAGKGTFGDTKGSGSEVNTYTKADGKFSITIKGDNLFLYLHKDSFKYDEEIFGAYKSYTAGKVYSNELLKLQAYAYFDAVFKGNNCILNDSIYFELGKTIPQAYSKIAFLRLGNGPHKYSYGGGALVVGDIYNYFWIKYQVNGEWKEKIDSVYIKSFETFKDTIYY